MLSGKFNDVNLVNGDRRNGKTNFYWLISKKNRLIKNSDQVSRIHTIEARRLTGWLAGWLRITRGRLTWNRGFDVFRGLILPMTPLMKFPVTPQRFYRRE